MSDSPSESAGSQNPLRTYSVRDAIKDVASLFTLISGLVLAFGTVIQRVQEWVPAITKVPKPFLFSSAVLFILVSLLLQNRRFVPKSQLINPQALSFDIKDRLVGRGADIDNLERLLSAERFLWVIGESGVGKSALLGAWLNASIANEQSVDCLLC